MEIEVLGGFGGECLGCRMTCLLIDERLALDAGSLSKALPMERQVGVRSVLLSHSHGVAALFYRERLRQG